MIQLTVSRTNNNDEERNLPSRFFPSSGSGHGWFQLEPAGEELPSHAELSWALQKWNDDCVLMDYDATTGNGRFVIVDWYAPAPGTVIELNLQREMNLEELDPDDAEWFDDISSPIKKNVLF